LSASSRSRVGRAAVSGKCVYHSFVPGSSIGAAGCNRARGVMVRLLPLAPVQRDVLIQGVSVGEPARRRIAQIVLVLLVLIFSANTAFADFPRVCRVLAEDHFLPLSLATRGRRLVYSEGIWALAFLTGILLVVFGGVTDRLIPLYAVGAFLAFTLSQAGMVAHWRKEGGPGALRSMLVNGLGATTTGITVLVVIVSKFSEGAWITVVAIPSILLLTYGIRRHYEKIQSALASPAPLDLRGNLPPVVAVPMQQWTKMGKNALSAALAISKEIKVLYVTEEDKCDEFHQNWHQYVVEPAKAVSLPPPELVVLESPYRFIVSLIVDYVLKLANDYPERRIVAVVPELVESRWYNYFLHSQRASLVKTLLLLKGNDRISVLNIPWYFRESE